MLELELDPQPAASRSAEQAIRSYLADSTPTLIGTEPFVRTTVAVSP